MPRGMAKEAFGPAKADAIPTSKRPGCSGTSAVQSLHTTLLLRDVWLGNLTVRRQQRFCPLVPVVSARGSRKVIRVRFDLVKENMRTGYG